MAQTKNYNIQTLLEIIDLPRNYLDYALDMLHDKKTNLKVLKSLYHYRKIYKIVNNRYKESINEHCRKTLSSVELVEFELALRDVLEVEITEVKTVPAMLEDLNNFLSYKLVPIRWVQNKLEPISATRIKKAWDLSRMPNADVMEVENVLMFENEEE